MATLTVDLNESLDQVKRMFVAAVLHEKKQNRTQTAKSLKVGVRTLQRYLKKFSEEKNPVMINHKELWADTNE